MKNKLLLYFSIAFFVFGSALYLAGSFANKTIDDQLSAQKISFPPAEVLEKDNPKLVDYAGQQVNTGTEAKAYSTYIEGHLEKVADGQTYSEVSSQYLKDTKNQTLSQQRMTLFMGETLRGLLLNAWGWSIIAQIAIFASYAMFALAIIMIFVYVVQKDSKSKTKKASSKKKKN